MTRRTFLAAAPALAGAPLTVPVSLITDSRAKFGPGVMDRFNQTIWPEAERDFGRCGIRLQAARIEGTMGRAPSDRPVFKGLTHGSINFVLTDALPIVWDHGKGLAGVATRYDGYDLCVAALPRAHGHRVPWVVTNTCVHELLHVLLMDTAEARPKGWEGSRREARIDWYATSMWLFGESDEVYRSTAVYLEGLRRRRELACTTSGLGDGIELGL